MQQSTCSICGGREGSDVLLHINNGARIDAAAGLSSLDGKERPDFTSLPAKRRTLHPRVNRWCASVCRPEAKEKWFMRSFNHDC